ncbi:unnamed protein product [Sphagnum tenellum]
MSAGPASRDRICSVVEGVAVRDRICSVVEGVAVGWFITLTGVAILCSVGQARHHRPEFCGGVQFMAAFLAPGIQHFVELKCYECHWCRFLHRYHFHRIEQNGQQFTEE